jgi:hypothetical protein
MNASSDNQSILEQLQRAGNALSRGDGAAARQALVDLRPRLDDTEELEKAIVELSHPGEGDFEACLLLVDQLIERYETTSSGSATEANPFKVPRPLTLSAPKIPLLPRASSSNAHDKETLKHPTVPGKGEGARPLSLTDRLRKAVQKESATQPEPIPAPAPEDEDSFGDLDLGLHVPSAQPVVQEPWDFDFVTSGPAPTPAALSGSASPSPFEAVDWDDSVPPLPSQEEPERQARRQRHETPIAPALNVEDLLAGAASEPESPAAVTAASPGLEDSSVASETGVMNAEAIARRLKFDPVDEDEFFAIADSLASEASEAVHPSGGTTDPRFGYRGEPVVPEARREPLITPPPIPRGEPLLKGEQRPGNPFAHQAPTGVRNEPLSSKIAKQQTLPPVQEERPVRGSLLEQARQLFEAGEYPSALDMVQALLCHGRDPKAIALQAEIERAVERLQHQRIGSLEQVPTLAISLAQLSELKLDHRAGFLISQIDGMMCFEDIIDLSTMPRIETMTLLAELCEKGVIVAH